MPKTKAASRELPTLQLERLRKKKGVSLEAISETTKISKRFLEAIEAERFDQLPGGLFSVSYLRQYARAIGLDEAQLVAHFVKQSKAEEEPAPVPPRRSVWFRWLRSSENLSRSRA
jgi:cytoskeletal protein RodZ